MKLLPISDAHLEIMQDGYRLQIPDTDADMILFLGDIAPGVKGMQWAIQQCERLGIEGIYLAGNHEYYQEDFLTLDDSLRGIAMNSPVTFLNCNELVVNDIRFLGCTMWTDFCAHGIRSKNLAQIKNQINDFHLIQVSPTVSMGAEGRVRKFLPEDALKAHQEHKNWLIDKLDEPFTGKTVLLTHHGISRKCQHPQYRLDVITNAFWSDLESCLEDKIDLACFGHTHANIDLICDAGFRIVSNQMGYRRKITDSPECSDFSFDCVIDTDELG